MRRSMTRQKAHRVLHGMLAVCVLMLACPCSAQLSPVIRNNEWFTISVEGSVPHARVGHQAAPGLTKSSMLVFGGRRSRVNTWDDSQLSTITDTWLLRQSASDGAWQWERVVDGGTRVSPEPRFCGSLTTIQAERMSILIGGQTSHTALSTMWAFNFESLGWQQLRPKNFGPLPRACHAATALDSDILVTGGNNVLPTSPEEAHTDPALAAPCMELWLYSTSGNSWAPMTAAEGPCPAPRYEHAVAIDAGRRLLYVHGGLVPSAASAFSKQWSATTGVNNGDDDGNDGGDGGDADAQPNSSAELWQLDLSVDPPRWEEVKLQLHPSPRFDHGMALLHRRYLYVFYGKQSPREYPADLVWYYDIEHNRWHERHNDQPHVPQPRSGMTTVAMTDLELPPACATESNDMGGQRQAANTTSTTAAMATPSAPTACEGSTQPAEFVIFFGGETELTAALGSAYKDSWLYTGSTDTWSQTSSQPFPVDRFNHAGSTMTSYAVSGSEHGMQLSVVFGGFNQVDGFLNDLWALAFADRQGEAAEKNKLVWTHIVPKDAAAPTPRAGHTMVTLAPERADKQVLLVHGGRDSVSHFSPLSTTHAFDTISETWSIVNNTGDFVQRTYHSAVPLGTNGMVVFGGQGFHDVALPQAPAQYCSHTLHAAHDRERPKRGRAQQVRDAGKQQQHIQHLYGHRGQREKASERTTPSGIGRRRRQERRADATYLPLTRPARCSDDEVARCSTVHGALSPVPTTTCSCHSGHAVDEEGGRSGEHGLGRGPEHENEGLQGKEGVQSIGRRTARHAHGHGADGSSNNTEYGLLGDVRLCEVHEGACKWTLLRVSGPKRVPDDGVIKAQELPNGRHVPKPRSHHSGLLVNLPSRSVSTMVVFGGVVGPSIIPSTAAESLDLAGDVWLLHLRPCDASRWQYLNISGAASPEPRWSHASAVVHGSKLVVSGGYSANRVLDDCWMLDLTSSPPTWTELDMHGSDLLVTRAGHTLLTMDVFVQEEHSVNLTTGIVALGGTSLDIQTIDTQTVSVLLPACNPGYASENFKRKPCLPCDTGFYSPYNTPKCLACPKGTTTNTTAATHYSNCSVCVSGFCNAGSCHVDDSRDAMTPVCSCSAWFSEHSRCTQPQWYWLLLIGVVLLVIVWRIFVACVRKRYVEPLSEVTDSLQTAMNQVLNLARAWQIQPEEIELIEPIDQDAPGAFGEVYRAHYHDREVAVKKLKAAVLKLSPENLDGFQKEVRVMRKLRHAHIVLFFGAGYDENGCPFLVTEFMARGSLTTVLQDKDFKMDWEMKLHFAEHAVKGMEYLHSQRPPCIHRDLKTANLLVTDKYIVKVSDFGTSALLDIGTTGIRKARGARKGRRVRSSHSISKTFNEEASQLMVALDPEADKLNQDDGDHETQIRQLVGTPVYFSPEVWQFARFSTKSDVFAFGIVLWEIMTREVNPYPFVHGPKSQLRRAVLDAGVRPMIPPWMPTVVKCLMEVCWAPEPRARPAFKELVPILQELVNMVDVFESTATTPAPRSRVGTDGPWRGVRVSSRSTSSRVSFRQRSSTDSTNHAVGTGTVAAALEKLRRSTTVRIDRPKWPTSSRPIRGDGTTPPAALSSSLDNSVDDEGREAEGEGSRHKAQQSSSRAHTRSTEWQSNRQLQHGGRAQESQRALGRVHLGGERLLEQRTFASDHLLQEDEEDDEEDEAMLNEEQPLIQAPFD